MRGKEFLEVARELAEGPTEAHRRSAVGRSYYALFLEVRDQLERWGFGPFGKEQVHDRILSAYLRSSDADIRQIAKILKRLKTQRNHADYILLDSQFFADPFIAGRSYIEAQQAIELLDQIDADPARRESAIASIPL